MVNKNPTVIVLSGPNGAGKSTISQSLFTHSLSMVHFVNADTLAKGLSAFRSDEMAVKAGKVMLEHLHDLAGKRLDFAFETTLASRTFAPWIAELRSQGYWFQLYYLWVPSPEFSIRRVRERVKLGGHGVPEETIRRRYARGLENFFARYKPIADSWEFYDNSSPKEPRLIAEGIQDSERIEHEYLWNWIQNQVQ